MVGTKKVRRMAYLPSLVEGINSLNQFGRVNPNDIVLHSTEERDRAEKFSRERRLAEKNRKLQEKKQEEEELACLEYKENERRRQHKRNNQPIYVPPNKQVPAKTGRGRGAVLQGAYNGANTGRAPGQLSQEQEPDRAFFRREQKVQNTLNQFSDSSLHSNIQQKLYWTSLGSNNHQDEHDKNMETRNLVCDSPSVSDQFEDAVSSSQTPSPSFYTFSSPSDSPVLHDITPSPPPPRPTVPDTPPTTRPRRHRLGRMAAKFPNSCEPDDEKPSKETVATTNGVKEDHEDPLAVLTSARASISRFRGAGDTRTNFDSMMKASQRVLSNDLVDPQVIFNAYAGANGHFTFKKSDFPPL